MSVRKPEILGHDVSLSCCPQWDDDREKDQHSAKDKEETLEEMLDDGDEEIEDDPR